MSVPASEPLLSSSQRRLAAFALGLFSFLAIVALFALILFVGGRLIEFFSGALWPPLLAGILALVLRPLVDALQRHVRRRLVAVIILYAAFLVVVACLLLLIIPPVIQQIIDFVAYAPHFWHSVVVYFQAHYPAWSEFVQQKLDNPSIKRVVEQAAGQTQALLSHTLPTLRIAGAGALGFFGFLTHAAVVPVYLFFFLLSRSSPTRRLPHHLGFVRNTSVRDDIVFLVREFVSIIESFFRGQLVIGLIMGVLLATGFTIAGLKFGLVIGLALGLLNIVPYLGTILGLSIALPLALFQPTGGWSLVCWVLAVFCAVQMIESWLLTPKIMGDRTGLHPVAIIFSVFFWGTVFGGVLGMLFAIPFTAFFVTAWRLLMRKYLVAAPPAVQI
ncbi:AI-2E family transporter [Horticoccus luteus]|uniref:AI-2E family transporter n=1 Tax=Horticoccus luteus TaxID=2862869 RepID=A0A8F9TYK8_9BACT|nr:AI-2E family transporter [Horticoccus luteus]QYM80133.1 AI-2E family transporter [Horticoccus luteus]